MDGFISWIESINGQINSIVWGPPMLILLVGTGIFMTILLKFFQVGKIGLWMKSTFARMFGKNAVKGDKANISPFQAVTTALASTVGTGNIVGVATAIYLGGPGAVFWMWVSAFFGMITKYSEIVLAMKYRETNKQGQNYGGPMYYIEKGLHMKWLAVIFAIFGALACFGIGNMTQSNSIADAVDRVVTSLSAPAIVETAPAIEETAATADEADAEVTADTPTDGVVEVAETNAAAAATAAAPFFTSFSWTRFIVGLVLAALVGLVIIGGIKRIATVTERLVPIMAVFYLIGGLIVILVNISGIGTALAEIFQGAFSFKSVGSGVMGYGIAMAMRYGFARGVFSNEAGLGSAPIAHAASSTKEPVEQGMWGIFEVFVDTLMICTVTALVILTSGVHEAGLLSGVALTTAAYETVFGGFAVWFVALAIMLFVFSTIIGWSYYGDQFIGYLTKENKTASLIYKVIFIIAIVFGAIGGLTLVWDIADTLNGLMAIPNLIAVLLLSGTVVTMTVKYLKTGSSLDQPATSKGKKR